MQLEVSFCRVASLLALGMISAACTFPSVEYEAEPVSEAACVAPTACMNDVEVCRKQADAQQMMCLSKCTTVCPSCGADFNDALSICVAQCEACSAGEGCANATESCKALAGVP